MSMGMGSSQRPNAALAGPPSSYRSQQDIMTSNSSSGYGGGSSQSSSNMFASSSRRESEGLGSQGVSSTQSSRAPTMHNTYSASNSPNLNRHSYTMQPGQQQSQLSRPQRSGTLNYGDYPSASTNGSGGGNAYREFGRSTSNGSNHNGSLGINSHVPPVPSMTSPAPLEQSFDNKISLGPVIPVQPEKDGQKDPPPTMRARSGTGKSSKDKKSMFGVLSGELTR